MQHNRAMQAALELSMLNLNNTSYSMSSPEPPYGLLENEVPIETLKPKSQNITRCVAVPSSEHVAEIVGRQGCRIKSLRAKTNTYIKTPVRGEDPVFVITGRPEDVAAAKREILAAAEHFSNIRTRRATTSIDGGSSSGDGAKVSIMVKVPYRVVGLVVGPRGTTVKRIQQLTNTYIVTPSRDKDPAFEVRGSPENVEKARIEIESYIQMRTGSANYMESSPESDLSIPQFNNACDVYDFATYPGQKFSEPAYPYALNDHNNSHFSPISDAIFNNTTKEPVDPYMNIATSDTSMAPTKQVFNFTSLSNALEYMNAYLPRPSPVRVQSKHEPAFIPEKFQPPSPTYSSDSGSSDGGYSTASPKQFYTSYSAAAAAACIVCNDNVTAALVPCGHNLFCFSCANHIAEYTKKCPVCDAQVRHALRIHFR